MNFAFLPKELVFGRSTLVGQDPMKPLSSFCLFAHLSLSFLKIGSLVFSGIVHDNSWPWYDEAWFKKKKKKMAAQI